MDKPLTQTLTVRIDFVIVVAGKKRFSQEPSKLLETLSAT